MKKLIQILALAFVLAACSKEDNTASKQFFYLRNNGSDMPVWAEGNFKQDKFIIMIHGGPGGNAQIYNALTDMSQPLEKEFVMLYWDQTGSGNAKGKLGSANFTIDSYVDDLEKLVDLIHHKYGDNKKIYLMGHSWGGTLSAAYLTNPARTAKVDGWIEIGGAHQFSDDKLILRKILNESIRQVANGTNARWQDIYNDCAAMDSNNLSDANISKLNGFGFEMEQLLTDSIAENGSGFNASKFTFNSAYNPLTATLNEGATNAQMFNQLKNANYIDKLDDLSIPSLFLWGRHDYVVPVESGIELHRRIKNPDKAIHIFERSGHSPMNNQIDAFMGVLMNWLRTH